MSHVTISERESDIFHEVQRHGELLADHDYENLS